MSTPADGLAEAFSRVGLFAGVPFDAVAPIVARCPIRRLQPGDLLLTPGQVNHDVFLLLDGRLRVRLESADSAFGFAVEASELVGEMSVIDGEVTTAFVVADRPSTVAVVGETCLWEDLAPIPGIFRNLLREMSTRMRTRSDAMFAAQRQKLRFEEMERELATARDIQANMLPHHAPLLPGFDRLDVQALMEAAREVGGDFYDAFALDPVHACVVVGDVCGKGMPAALFMVRVLTLLRAEARGGGSIAAIVGRLNDLLAADNPSCTFVTLCVAVIDVRSGDTTIVTGGHEAPLARLGGGTWEFLPRLPGPFVGVIENARFETWRFTLRPRDMLILFTDGVTEAEDAHRRQYTAARLRDQLNSGSPTDAEGALRAIRVDVAAHAAGHPPSDDITILALGLN